MEGEPGITIRLHRSDDMEWVVRRHGEIYAEEYGWDSRFRDLCQDIAAKFAESFDAERERCWIAEKDDERLGCVFLVRRSDEVAQLRLLLVEPHARGAGLGRQLVQECIDFAAARGYKRIRLWTNDVLLSARRIYESFGFTLVEEERHASWGKELTSQTWELPL